MNNKTKKAIDDYVLTLLTEEPLATETSEFVADNIEPSPNQTSSDNTIGNKNTTDNLVPFPGTNEKVDKIEALNSVVDTQHTFSNTVSRPVNTVSPPVDSAASNTKAQENSNPAEIEPYKAKGVNESKSQGRPVIERAIPQVDLTSHTQLNVAQKLLQAYELRQQQELKTQQEIKQNQQIALLVKQAADNKLSMAQKEKLLVMLEQKQLLKQAEIVAASIEAMTATEVVESVVIGTPVEDLYQGRFQCLVFHVGSLKVAVPLSKLGGIHKIDSDITPIFGKPKWFMGIINYNEVNHHLVDTAYWIAPQNYQQFKTDYTHYIVLDNSNWAIACSKIGNALTLTREDVKWASENSKKSWFAGMLVHEMCALLNIDNFIDELLASGINN